MTDRGFLNNALTDPGERPPNQETDDITLPELEKGYAVKPGETVILRLLNTKSFVNPIERFERTRHYLNLATEKTGVHFILIDDSMEVVQP